MYEFHLAKATMSFTWLLPWLNSPDAVGYSGLCIQAYSTLYFLLLLIAAYVVSSTWKIEIVNGLPVCGVNTDDFIYILSFGTHAGYTVRVYDVSIPYDLLMIIMMDELSMGTPFNMIVIESTNTLFIGDDRRECIWKIDMEKNEAGKWLSELGKEFSFSIANDNHLLVLRFIDDILHLEIYDQDAELKSSVSLPNDFGGLFDAIQKPSGEFIVSHRSNEYDDLCISFLSSDGKVISQFRFKETVGFTDARVFYETNDATVFAIEGSSWKVYVLDKITENWNLTDLSLILRHSSRLSLAFRGTDGRIIRPIREMPQVQFAQLLFETGNGNLLVAENVFGHLYLFDTNSLNWSKIGRIRHHWLYLQLRHHRLHYDSKKTQLISIGSEVVEILAFKKY